ncbi:MAG TPA: Tll0287-like domain-containing protein [Candidatus Hypogeohydataceae bacterium YC41]
MKRIIVKLTCLLAILFVSSFLAKGVKAQVHDYVYDYERMSRAVVSMLNAVENFIAVNIDVIDCNNAFIGKPIPKDAACNYKGINPEGGCMRIGKELTQRTGIKVKFASEGKGKLGLRNKENTPDEWESNQLKKFATIRYPKGVGFGEVEMIKETLDVQYRYIYPLYVEPSCLKCHGDPATSPTKDGKDVTGNTMEGYKLVELIGAISIVSPIEAEPTTGTEVVFYDYNKMAKVIINLLQMPGYFMARNLDVIDTYGAFLGKPVPQNEPSSYKGINPVAFAKTITTEFAASTGIKARFISEGKGSYGPRNPSEAAPDPWELIQLRKYTEKAPNTEGYGEVIKISAVGLTVYRYFYPLYINELCQKCHGDPATSPTRDGKDITGAYMENYKVGDLRGGISLTFPVK